MDTLYAREAAEEARHQHLAELAMAEPRVCAECRWYTQRSVAYADTCVYPLMPFIVKQNVINQMVRGQAYTDGVTCALARSNADECGPEGKYWEQKS